jgi:TonB-linked SusC/RagA family outer membrane protein
MLKKLLFSLICLLSTFTIAAQTVKITGTVTDETTEPITGASVFINGTTIGTTSDMNGKFNLEIPADAQTLTVSYIGMKTKEIAIGSTRAFNIILSESVSEIDEVLVVAYGTTTRASFTGSAVKIGSKEMELRPITNITQAFSGAVAGVQVGNNSGSPGTAPTIRIRGISSINGSNDPLYVVDGVPYENALSSINPEDVESFTILKDASSSALYGSRAAAGVIMITTKKGQKGKPSFSIKANQSFSTVGMDFYDTVGAEDYYVLNWEKVRNAYYYNGSFTAPTGTDKKPDVMPFDIACQLATGVINSYKMNGTTGTYKSVYEQLGYNPFNVPNNAIVSVDGIFNPNAQFLFSDDMDWMNGVRRLGKRSDVAATYSGATDKTDYFVSLGYLNDNGYMRQSSFNRITARANINTQVSRLLKTGLNINGNISDGMTPSGNSPYYYPLYMGPIYPIHLHNPETGEYIFDLAGNKRYDYGIGDTSLGLLARPINAAHNTIAELDASHDKYRRSLLSAKTYAEFKFLNDFTFTVNYKADLNTYYSTEFTPVLEGTASPGALTKSTSQRLTWNFNQLLEYKKTFKNKHNVDIMVGHEAFSTSIFDMSGHKRVQVNDGIPELANYSELNSLTSSTSDYNTESYLSRANYDYDGKYMASFSYRADGSSKFYKDSRWGSFYSAGLAWRIDKEVFMKDISFIDLLKIRGSYGEVGNDNGIGYFAWQSLYSIYPNAGEPGYAASSLGNRNLQWETNINADVALEFGLFNRITGSIEYFHKQSDNMLYSVPLQPSSGFSTRDENAFSMRNRGLEVEMAVDILKNKDGFNLKLKANATHFKNRVMDMPVDPYINGSKKIEVGHSIYDYYLRHSEGVDPATGGIMYTVDPELAATEREVLVKNKQYNIVNGDTAVWTYNYNQAGRFYTGKEANPKVFGGISADFGYKNLSVNIRTSYQFGGWTYDANYKSLMNYGSTSYGRTFHVDILKRWQKPGDITDVPRIDGTDGVATSLNADNTDKWLVSNNYFELSNISVNYNLPKSLTNMLGVQKVGVWANGEMLYRYTVRKGLNVRYSFNGTVDDGYLPARTYTVGLNITF